MDPSRIIAGLVARGLPVHVAQGIAANMAAESRLNPGINELAPLVPGSRGGFGLNQWTGPRRRDLEAAAQARGVSVDDLDFQLDYTMEELRGPESRAMQALQGARTAEEAARIYSDTFLRPGIPHMDRRVGYAQQFAGMGGNAAPAPSYGQQGAQQPQQPANALAAVMAQRPQQPERPSNALAALDPAAFMARPFAAPVQGFATRPYLSGRSQT